MRLAPVVEQRQVRRVEPELVVDGFLLRVIDLDGQVFVR